MLVNTVASSVTAATYGSALVTPSMSVAEGTQLECFVAHSLDILSAPVSSVSFAGTALSFSQSVQDILLSSTIEQWIGGTMSAAAGSAGAFTVTLATGVISSAAMCVFGLETVGGLGNYNSSPFSNVSGNVSANLSAPPETGGRNNTIQVPSSNHLLIGVGIVATKATTATGVNNPDMTLVEGTADAFNPTTISAGAGTNKRTAGIAYYYPPDGASNQIRWTTLSNNEWASLIVENIGGTMDGMMVLQSPQVLPQNYP